MNTSLHLDAELIALPDRGVIAVAGEAARGFLDNLITNDMAQLDSQAALFAGLLSPQGKILFEFFVVKQREGYLLETRRDQAADLVKRLSMYRLRAKVTILDQSPGSRVLAVWGTAANATGSRATYRDPRHASLGSRLIDATDAATPEPVAPVQGQAYRAHRMTCGVAEGGIDYPLGDTYPHEANYDLLNGVSFTKGCYVGQEVVARMENKTVVRKRVVAVTGDGLATGAEIKFGDAVIGAIGSVDGRHGLALVRLDRAMEAVDQAATLTANDHAITVDPAAIARYRQSVASKSSSAL
jgi:tRNA-modifying protein YgfZ